MSKQDQQTGTNDKFLATNEDNVSNMPTTNFMEEALQNLTNEEKKDLQLKAADEALRLQTKSAEMSLDDNAARHETYDHLNAYNSLDKSKILHGHKVVSDYKTGAGTRRIESKSGITCFVVTASYGDINHPTVLFYRQFRDVVLIQHTYGRQFIAWYYKKGPKLSDYIRTKPVLMLIVRTALKIVQLPLSMVLQLSYKKYPEYIRNIQFQETNSKR